MQLRSHQIDVINKARVEISGGNKKPLIFAPCSFGKTIVAAEIARLAVEKGNKVLFIVHRRLLALQTKEKFDSYGLKSSIIMAGYDTDFTAPVMITTYQTYTRRLRLGYHVYNQFFHDASVIFVDECHLGISSGYKEIYSYYEERVIIGLTGTPSRGDQRPLGDVFDCIVKSVGIKQLTKDGWLVPLRYFSADAPDLSDVKIVAGDYHKGQLQKTMMDKKLIGDVLENWLKLAEDRPTIVFSSGVKHSIYLQNRFQERGISCAHLESHSPHDERMRVLRKFRDGDIRVITNCQLFTEGYDADFVRCIAIARPTKSLPLWIQMVGRGQRIVDGKLDCYIMDFGGNIERHGLIEWDREWTLEGKDKAWSRPRKRDVDKLVKCRACHKVFSGASVCPDCGTPVMSFGRNILTVEAELEELESKEKYTTAEKRQWYGMLKWYCQKKGYKEGWVAWKYKERFKVWPQGMKDTAPIVVDDKFLNWITYQNIKSAKRREKEKMGENHGYARL